MLRWVQDHYNVLLIRILNVRYQEKCCLAHLKNGGTVSISVKDGEIDLVSEVKEEIVETV